MAGQDNMWWILNTPLQFLVVEVVNQCLRLYLVQNPVNRATSLSVVAVFGIRLVTQPVIRINISPEL